MMSLRRVLASELLAFVGELIQVQLHEVIYQVTHFLLVVLQSLTVNYLFVFKVLQEVSQILHCLLVLWSILVMRNDLSVFIPLGLLYVLTHKVDYFLFGIRSSLDSLLRVRFLLFKLSSSSFLPFILGITG